MSAPVVVDISSYQPGVNFVALAKAGIIGVIHKASQGTGWTDHCYAGHREQARSAGLLWGAYHFMDMGDPVAQAVHFINAADPDAKTLLCLDWENVPNTSKAPSRQAAQSFLQEIDRRIGCKALLYSGNVAKEQISGVDPYFAAHRLWLCQYASHFTTQASWHNQPWLWQNNGDNYGPGPHKLPGFAGLIDNSCIVGDMTIERLKAEWAG